jgi:hypothetical protein
VVSKYFMEQARHLKISKAFFKVMNKLFDP